MNARADRASIGITAQGVDHLHTTARWIFTLVAAGVLGVVPWLFGGNGPDGYWWIVWSGRLCLLPLTLWMVASALRGEMPGPVFWVPVICWSLLAAQIVASTYNKSSVPVAPWLGYGFDAVPHNPYWPSTSFKQSTQVEGRFYLSLGLLALTAHSVGCSARQRRGLLWVLAATAAILAIVGIPYKFSGQLLILGKWPAPEWYFYATFLYHNHWCAFALFAVTAVAALFVSYPNISVRGLLAVMGGAIAASAPLSTSRLGTAAMGALGLVMFATWLRQRKRAPADTRLKAQPPVVALVMVGVLMIAGGAFVFYKMHGAPGGHRTWSSVLRSNPFGIRQTLAEDALPMVGDKPVFGWGLGGFGGGFRFYQRPETRVVHNQGRITLYNHPHNDWLEKLVELGVLGSILLLVPWISWIKLAAHAGPRSESERWILIGCAGLLVFALGDAVFINRAVAASFALLFPLALRHPA